MARKRAAGPFWAIYSEQGIPPLVTLLGSCTREQAESVLETLVYDTSVNDDLYLQQILAPEPPFEPVGDKIPFKPKENHVG